MPAATVTGRQQNQVVGARRQVIADSIVFAANGDTWTVPGIKRIESTSLTCATNTAFGFTKLGNVLTLVSGGALTFFGSVQGL